MNVLVINTGSSSLKFRLYDMPAEDCLAWGRVENIGQADSRIHLNIGYHGRTTSSREARSIADHGAGLEWMMEFLQQAQLPLQAIGHRVVHGGMRLQTPVRIDAGVIAQIKACIPLAPVHNPINLAGIETAVRLCPTLPQVAVFDTAFFRQLPAHSQRYAVPEYWYDTYGVRRFGFHGISHQFVVSEAAALLHKPLQELKLVSLHLGNGASIAAVRHGVCIDTSMGMTPLEGLMMGTRSGDIDPGIIFYLAREHKLSLQTIEDQLNADSGLKGICGENDMRAIVQRAAHGDARARLARDMFIYRLQKYIGAYSVALDGMDGLIFTGGIGEHDANLREAVCNGLRSLGVVLNSDIQQQSDPQAAVISDMQSRVSVMRIPTNEELAIARDTVAALSTHPVSSSAAGCS